MPDLFLWDRTPDPAWQEALDTAFPRAGNGSGLVVRWGAGLPERPTQRWVIDQMIPADQCWVTDFREARRLPIPPMGQYLSGLERYRGKVMPPWLQRSHDTMERTRCLAVPFWIVQGAQGGHPLRYEKVDQLWSQFLTGSLEPPHPGALPYADFDNRVVRALVGRDRWRGQYQSVLAEVEGSEAEAEKRIRHLMHEWVEAQVSEVVDEVMPTLVDADLPRESGGGRDYRAAVEEYLESGEIAGPVGNLTGAGSLTVTTRR